MTTPDAVRFPFSSPHAPNASISPWPPTCRYKGQSRLHAESDLRAYLTWCLERGADPLHVSRPQVELYVR
jgi:integrase/recombinase XerD